MSEDRRNVLQVLRFELNFLEQGGYGRTVRQTQISPFRDNLSCLNFGDPLRSHACRECCLYDFVPERSRTEDIPCHFIPLDERGSTVADLLKSGSIKELEPVLKGWLRTTITKLEKEREQVAHNAD